MLTNLRNWLLVTAVASTVLLAGCAAEREDDDPNVTIIADGDDDTGEKDEVRASGEARGSPGWGMMGALAGIGVAALAYVRRRRA